MVPKDDSEPERRVDPDDGGAYTKEEFAEAYGGLAEWETAAVRSEGAAEADAEAEPAAGREPLRRVDPSDGGHYTQEEFEEAYGGLAEWEDAAPAPPGPLPITGRT